MRALFITLNLKGCGNMSLPVALQLFSVRDDMAADFEGTLKKVRSMGYQGVEFAGLYGNDVEMVKKLLLENDLEPVSAHISIDEFLSDLDGTIDRYLEIGCKYAAIPYLVEELRPGGPKWGETVENIKKIALAAKKKGLQLMYHNHDFEFAKVVPGGTGAVFGRHNKGEKIYDLFLKDTDPDLVFFEMDVYWTVIGQNDPVEYMKKYPDRIKLLHIKDRAILGQSGFMNFEMIFKQAYQIGVKEYYVELEGMPDGRTQFAGVKGCADYLLKAKFVK